MSQDENSETSDSVIHRKVTNGFRSDWGSKAYTDLLSVVATSKIKGQRVFETLVNLMGHPVLQFLDASSPIVGYRELFKVFWERRVINPRFVDLLRRMRFSP
jgi:folate-dependent tRNA-U54 methylase TrmFO/GidA